MPRRPKTRILTLFLAALVMLFLIAPVASANDHHRGIAPAAALPAGPCADHVPGDGPDYDSCDLCSCCAPSRVLPAVASVALPSLTVLRVARSGAAANPAGLPQDVLPRPPRPTAIG